MKLSTVAASDRRTEAWRVTEDGQLKRRWLDAGAAEWSPWRHVPFAPRALGVAAISGWPEQIEVFVVDASGAVWNRWWWLDRGWLPRDGAFNPLGRPFAEVGVRGFSALSAGAGHFDVFVEAADDRTAVLPHVEGPDGPHWRRCEGAEALGDGWWPAYAPASRGAYRGGTGMAGAEPASGDRHAFGGYDGVDLWALRSWNVESAHQQVYTSLHERLHHELQSSTLWGLITRFCADFARRPEWATSARLLFWIGAMRSQLVHETYATTIATGVDEEYLALLEGNPEYLERYRHGIGLLDSTPASWPRDRFLVDAALRACMMSPGLVPLAAEMPALKVANLDRPEHRPDERLPRLGGIDLRELRDAVVEPPASVARLRELHDVCAAYLSERGLPTANSEEVRAAVAVLVDRASDLLGLEIEVDQLRDDPVADDAEAWQRERIELNPDRLPAVVMSLNEAAAEPSLFMRDHPQMGSHVLIVWLTPEVLAHQLAGFSHPGPGHVLALQAAGTDAAGNAVARLALADETADPSELAAAFTKVETLILTTLSSLVDAPPSAAFAGDQDLYVVVDQPAVEALRHAFDRGAPVRWDRLEVGGERRLKGVVWEAAGLPGVIHLHLASEAGHLALVRWLSEQPADTALADRNLLRSRQMQIDAIVQHLFAAWHVLERQGPTR